MAIIYGAADIYQLREPKDEGCTLEELFGGDETELRLAHRVMCFFIVVTNSEN